MSGSHHHVVQPVFSHHIVGIAENQELSRRVPGTDVAGV